MYMIHIDFDVDSSDEKELIKWNKIFQASMIRSEIREIMLEHFFGTFASSFDSMTFRSYTEPTQASVLAEIYKAVTRLENLVRVIEDIDAKEIEADNPLFKGRNSLAIYARDLIKSVRVFKVDVASDLTFLVKNKDYKPDEKAYL